MNVHTYSVLVVGRRLVCPCLTARVEGVFTTTVGSIATDGRESEQSVRRDDYKKKGAIMSSSFVATPKDSQLRICMLPAGQRFSNFNTAVMVKTHLLFSGISRRTVSQSAMSISTKPISSTAPSSASPSSFRVPPSLSLTSPHGSTTKLRP